MANEELELVKLARVRAVREWQALDAQRTQAQNSGNVQAAQAAQQQMDSIARGYGNLELAPRHIRDISAGGQEAGVDLMMGHRQPSLTQSMEGPNQGGYVVRKMAKPDSPVAQGHDMTALMADKQMITETARMDPSARAMVPAMHGHDTHTNANGQVHNVSYHEYVPNAQPIAPQNRQSVAQQLEPLRELYGMRDVPLIDNGRARGNFENVAHTPQGPKVLDFLPHGNSLDVTTHQGRDIPEGRYTTPTGELHTQTKYTVPENATPAQHSQVLGQLRKDVFAGKPAPAPKPAVHAPTVRPIAKVASGALPWLASGHAEHLTDLGGLGAMALGSADNLRSQLLHKDDEKGSLLGGSRGRQALDLGGLAAMAAPSLAALRHTGNEHAAGGGQRWVNLANLAGLGALGVSSIDKLQAHLRAGSADEAHHKLLLPHAVHQALDVGGLGALAATAALQARGGSLGDKLRAGTLGAGYATLAAPVADELQAKLRSAPGENPEAKQLLTGAVRPATELAGLSLLAAPSILAKHGSLNKGQLPAQRNGPIPMRVTKLLKRTSEGSVFDALREQLHKQAEAQAGNSSSAEYQIARPRGIGAKALTKPWEVPAREDMYPDKHSVEDRREVASTIPAAGQSYLYDQQVIG